MATDEKNKQPIEPEDTSLPDAEMPDAASLGDPYALDVFFGSNDDGTASDDESLQADDDEETEDNETPDGAERAPKIRQKADAPDARLGTIDPDSFKMKLDMSETWEPEIAKAIVEMNDHYAKVVSQLAARLDAATDAQRRTSMTDTVKQLPPVYRAVLGKPGRMDAVRSEMGILAKAYADRNLSEADLLQKAVGSLYGEEIASAAGAVTKGKIDNRRSQFLARPTGINGKQPAKTGRKAAEAAVQRMIRSYER